MKIKVERIKNDVLEIAKIGVQKEGVTRLAFTEEDLKARKLLIDIMHDANLNVTVDKAGNIIGSIGSFKNLMKPQKTVRQNIIIGSHIDTVPNGGKFDGVLGVCAGIECLRVLRENNYETRHPIEVVSFSDEEGSLTKGLFGSRALFGEANGEEIYPLKRNLGWSKEIITRTGVRPNQLDEVSRNPTQIKAYLELHIEQGPVLDSKNIPIGIVKGITGIYRYGVEIFGEANHAGTTLMEFRDDAVVKASKIILYIPELIEKKRINDDYFVGTVGKIQAFPGAFNVIPGKVKCLLELRALKRDYFSSFMEDLQKFMADLNILALINEVARKEPVILQKEVQKVIEEVCKENNIEFHKMVSGAGHDAMVFARYVPTGMIFVPSKNGKSHCPEEQTEWSACGKGAQILLNTLVKIDQT